MDGALTDQARFFAIAGNRTNADGRRSYAAGRPGVITGIASV